MEYEVIITDKLNKVKNKRARKGIKIKNKERGQRQSAPAR